MRATLGARPHIARRCAHSFSPTLSRGRGRSSSQTILAGADGAASPPKPLFRRLDGACPRGAPGAGGRGSNQNSARLCVAVASSATVLQPLLRLRAHTVPVFHNSQTHKTRRANPLQKIRVTATHGLRRGPRLSLTRFTGESSRRARSYGP